MTGREFLDKLNILSASKKGFWSMEIVISGRKLLMLI
jgi:hypothetical protein